MQKWNEPFDVVGIGAGPSNLCAAILAEEFTNLRTIFFEKTHSDDLWHSGLLLNESEMQTSYLKDLVSCIEPSSKYTFLNYLKNQGRLYHFINCKFSAIPRLEFAKYIRHVRNALPNITHNCSVRAIDCDQEGFIVSTNLGQVHARHIIVGVGKTPKIPDFAKDHVGQTVFHGLHYKKYQLPTETRSVAVIGGGQTGAEIFLDLITKHPSLEKVTWISRRNNFHVLDDSPFINELFSPGYTSYFYELEDSLRHKKLKEQYLASDGISQECLLHIYRSLYKQTLLKHQEGRFQLLPGREVVRLSGDDQKCWSIHSLHQDSGSIEIVHADVIILATGLSPSYPSFLEDFVTAYSQEKPTLRFDFSLKHDLLIKNRAYFQNFGRHSHGIADPNLSLAPWRSAVIMNSILSEKKFIVEDMPSFLLWKSTRAPRQGHHHWAEVGHAEI